ncbi:MAG: hypothetical protein P8Y80_09955 [Acidobacteriota bacterium]
MNRHTRTCIAFVAASVISGIKATSIYDYDRSRHLNFSGTVSESNVEIYDYERSCRFGGRLPSLYDYDRNVDILLQIDKTSFSGYDYGDDAHFSGHVSNGSVSLYDNSESKYFNYSI